VSETETFTLNEPHQGAWLVYINGIEIPCPQVNVGYGVWMIPEATLSFPPHRLLQRLGAEDKLEVVVFFLDDLADKDRPTFKLLFEGEIIGWSYTSSDHGQMMTFNAVADISIFSQLYFFFMNNVDTIAEGTLDNSDRILTTGAAYPTSLFTKGLFADNENAPDVTRPYEILQNVLIGMLSNKIPEHRRSLPGTNFFARWARKRNFVNRFAALPYFEDSPDQNRGVFPIFKSVQNANVIDVMRSDLSASVGQAGSIWDVLKMITSVSYTEIAMLPTAPCFRVNLEDGRIIGPASTRPSVPNRAALEPLRLVNYFIKPQMLFGVPPSCNVIFPSMAPSLQYSENYLQQPTRTYINDSLIYGLMQQHTSQDHVTAATLRVAYPPEVDAAIRRQTTGTNQKNSSVAQDSLNNGKNVLVWPEEFYKGPVVNRTSVPSWFTLLKSREQHNETGTTELNSLYALYTQYEHFRTRYEKRGGAVDMAWNPYVVPGFPCMVFDRRANAFDLAGYLMQVNQTLSFGAMRTSVNYSYGRTVQEMLDVLTDDMSRLGVALAAAPADPVDNVREITQDQTSAENFYRALFFGRQATPGKDAAFDLTKAVGYVREGVYDYAHEEAVDPITIDGPRMQEKRQTFTGGGPALAEASVQAHRPVTHNLDGSRELQPRQEFQPLFDSYDAAMRYIARPICTLEEYVSFLHGGKTVQELEVSGQLESKVDFGYSSGTSTAAYWERIRRLRQGPGDAPVPAATGATVSPPPAGGTTPTAVPYTATPTGVPPNFPQTRADWDSVLIAYRNEVLTRQAPQR
jgi:hypothetical protein